MLKSIITNSIAFSLLAAYAIGNQAWAGNILTVVNWLIIVVVFLSSITTLLAFSFAGESMKKVPTKKSTWVSKAIFIFYVVLLAASGFVFTSFALLLSWLFGLVALKVAHDYQAEATDV